jgi:hypothetical protein
VRFHVEIVDLQSDDVMASEYDADDWSNAIALAWQEWDQIYSRRPSRGRLVVEHAPADAAHV